MKEISPNDPAFPSALNDVDVERLFVRGTIPDQQTPAVAVVGTRRCSPEALKTTRDLVTPIARAGTVVVSGLAEGIDTAAHEAALDGNGTTIAVLGTGLDDESIYPRRNVDLARTITENGGALISEYEPGTPGLRHHFPARNRIIAALADLLLVVEAPAKSGALITARHADRLDRPLAAVPGARHDERRAGSNALLEDGAAAVTSAERLAQLCGVPLDESGKKPYHPETPEDAALLKALAEGPRAIAALLDESGIAPADALPRLTALEHDGVIEDLGGKRYAIKRDVVVEQ